MTSQPFEGHVSAMRADAEYWGAEDVLGRDDVPVQIVRCNHLVNHIACGKKQKEMYTLTVMENGVLSPKAFWIKSTNRKRIAGMYSPNVKEWAGKWLWLYAEECRSPQGGMTWGIRIRDRKDAPKGHAEAKPNGKAPPQETPFRKMSLKWKEWREMSHGDSSTDALRAFIADASGGTIAPADAFKPDLHTTELLEICNAKIDADMPSETENSPLNNTDEP